MFKKNKKQQSFQIDQQEISTIIGEGYIFTGEVQGSSVIRIEGKIIGNVNVEAGVILGEKGVIDGNITSQSVIVFGTVNGNVKTTQLEIKKSGHVNGDIATDTVEIELGAHYNGKLAMVPQQQLKEAS
jgi:cytoskeletal protein CcmA (bactofilin family)